MQPPPDPPATNAGHRGLVVLRGTRATTGASAHAVVAELDAAQVLWVSAANDPGHAYITHPNAARRLLGRGYDAVVLDCHDGVEPDLLGVCHGFVWGGGALVLRLPPSEVETTADRDAYAVLPYTAADVVPRFRRRLERILARTPQRTARALPARRYEPRGTPEQAAAVAWLLERLIAPAPTASVLLSDRGRGKSSALGLAIREIASQHPTQRVAVVAQDTDGVREILRFAVGAEELPADAPPSLALRRATDVAREPDRYDVIVVDEAAKLPVAVLKRLVIAHPRARLAFATTAHGYEGTGRGFVLRFVRWLRAHHPSCELRTLTAPIRWAADDPLEAFIFDALLLDATPDAIDLRTFDRAQVYHVALDRAALTADDKLLRGFFGLLVRAHYRTTPSDLRRLLDAPNLTPHALMHGGAVVAATLVAREGGLTAAQCQAAFAGRGRLRGQALADILVAHLGQADAGQLTMARSVRIAVHPDLRRRGLGSQLIAAVHAAHADVDLFGTVFGATPELLAFRHQAGYELARIGASRGARSGEPAVMMLRPLSEPARAVFARARGDLARNLPLQLELLRADGEDPAADNLEATLRAHLPAPLPWQPAERDAVVASYVFGPRTVESVAAAVTDFVRAQERALDDLPPWAQALIRTRLLERRSWSEVTAAAQIGSTTATMRALRRALRLLFEATRSGV